jgi:hypothetical protein
MDCSLSFSTNTCRFMEFWTLNHMPCLGHNALKKNSLHFAPLSLYSFSLCAWKLERFPNWVLSSLLLITDQNHHPIDSQPGLTLSPGDFPNGKKVESWPQSQTFHISPYPALWQCIPPIYTTACTSLWLTHYEVCCFSAPETFSLLQRIPFNWSRPATGTEITSRSSQTFVSCLAGATRNWASGEQGPCLGALGSASCTRSSTQQSLARADGVRGTQCQRAQS